MTIIELAKEVANDFNLTIKNNDFENFKEMRRIYDWGAKDIRNEIFYIANDILNAEYDYHVRKFGTWKGYRSVVVLDDCSVFDEKKELTYGQFKKMVFADVK